MHPDRTPPRALRFLVVDDEPVSTGVPPALELVTLPLTPGVVPKPPQIGIRRWGQAVRLLQTDQVGPFDLLAIDIRWAEDPSTSASGDVPPFGLLLGLGVLAKRAPWGAPLAYRVCSVASKDVAGDPVAQVAFSLLAALRGDAPVPAGVALRDWAPSALAALPSAKTTDTWRALVRDFREDVLRRLELAGPLFAWVDREGLKPVDELLRDPGHARPGAAVRFWVYDGKFALEPRSLFADLWDDPTRLADEGRAWLARLDASNVEEAHDRAYDDAEGALDQLGILHPDPWRVRTRPSPRGPLEVDTDPLRWALRDAGPRADVAIAAMILMLWLRRSRRPDADLSPSAVEDELGFGPSASSRSKLARRAIARATSADDYTISEFLADLGEPKHRPWSAAQVRDHLAARGLRPGVWRFVSAIVDRFLRDRPPPVR